MPISVSSFAFSSLWLTGIQDAALEKKKKNAPRIKKRSSMARESIPSLPHNLRQIQAGNLSAQKQQQPGFLYWRTREILQRSLAGTLWVLGDKQLLGDVKLRVWAGGSGSSDQCSSTWGGLMSSRPTLWIHRGVLWPYHVMTKPGFESLPHPISCAPLGNRITLSDLQPPLSQEGKRKVLIS